MDTTIETPLVTGSAGRLGTALQAAMAEAYPAAIFATRDELDISDYFRLESEFERLRPTVVINTASLTHVDGCEDCPELADEINNAGARNVVGDKPLHTFTAGYGPDDREIVNAAGIAETLRTRHHEVLLHPQDLPTLLPEMVWLLEEPIGREDIAYLFVAARRAARHVDVMLAGFGFDGLFAGLPRHRLVQLQHGDVGSDQLIPGVRQDAPHRLSMIGG